MFFALALPTLLLALAMLTARRVVRALFALMGAVVGLSFLYFLIGADAAGAGQLMIYAGGVLVLLLFGVMTATDENAGEGPRSLPVQIVSGLGLAAVLLAGLVRVFLPALKGLEGTASLASYQGGSLAGAGRELVGYQAAPFEWATVLLLLALAFAAPLALRAGKGD